VNHPLTGRFWRYAGRPDRPSVRHLRNSQPGSRCSPPDPGIRFFERTAAALGSLTEQSSAPPRADVYRRQLHAGSRRELQRVPDELKGDPNLVAFAILPIDPSGHNSLRDKYLTSKELQPIPFSYYLEDSSNRGPEARGYQVDLPRTQRNQRPKTND